MTPRLCKTCGKESRGICVERRDEFRHIGYDYYCSIKCRDAKTMTDFTVREEAAVRRAMYYAAEYLESIGKSDLEDLTWEEAFTFFKVYTSNYHEAMASEDILTTAELFS